MDCHEFANANSRNDKKFAMINLLKRKTMNNTRFAKRLEHFTRAFLNLQEVARSHQKNFSNLEKEGIIQRFEILIELSWKVMKSYLELQGFEVKSPKESVRKAFELGLIKNPQAWLEALDIRNITSHTYTQSELDENVRYILGEFYPLVEALQANLEARK